MWEPFHVGLEPQPLQNSCVICSCSPVGTQETSQVWANTFEGNNLIMAPYANPHHMKDVKHLVYAGMGCGIHFVLGQSHIYCTMVSFATQQGKWISADVPNSNGNWPTHVVVMK